MPEITTIGPESIHRLKEHAIFQLILKLRPKTDKFTIVKAHEIVLFFLLFTRVITAHTGHNPAVLTSAARFSMGTKSEDAIKAGFAEGAVLEGEEAAKLEEEYVHKVYDVIAPHFSHTRHSPWPKVGILPSSQLILRTDKELPPLCACKEALNITTDRRARMPQRRETYYAHEFSDDVIMFCTMTTFLPI